MKNKFDNFVYYLPYNITKDIFDSKEWKISIFGCDFKITFNDENHSKYGDNYYGEGYGIIFIKTPEFENVKLNRKKVLKPIKRLG
jgi:hypothetical protein